jgi:hypothetical protein
MIDLGLSQLTDDQLVELLSEICAEAAKRDPFVRKATQNAIDAQAKEAKLLRDAARSTIREQEQKLKDLEVGCKAATAKAIQQYRQQLETDVFMEIQEEIRLGIFRPMTPAQEADVIFGAAQKANASALNGVKPEEFDANRKAVMRNLIRMGHSAEDVERLYGKF